MILLIMEIITGEKIKQNMIWIEEIKEKTLET